MLGAGGAGRAVAAGLAQAGAGSVALLSRDPPRVDPTIDPLRAAFPHTAFTNAPWSGWDPLASRAGLVVVAVSAAGRDAVRALDPAPIPRDATWCDLNYWDGDPPHREAMGDRFLSGHGMLVHQAALAFERWTGIAPDPTDLPEVF